MRTTGHAYILVNLANVAVTVKALLPTKEETYSILWNRRVRIRQCISKHQTQREIQIVGQRSHAIPLAASEQKSIAGRPVPEAQIRSYLQRRSILYMMMAQRTTVRNSGMWKGGPYILCGIGVVASPAKLPIDKSRGGGTSRR